LSEEKTPTGIAELDEILGGGFFRDSLILLSGNPGTGKTVLSTQYLHNGALQFKERGMYVSFSEGKAEHYRNMRTLGMNLQSIEDEGLFKFLDFTAVRGEGMTEALDAVLDEVTKFRPKRLVIDSISVILQNLKEEEARVFLHSVLYKLMKTLDVTCILIGEMPIGVRSIGYGVEEFVADGIITLSRSNEGGAERKTLDILKMRGMPLHRSSYEYLIDGRYGGIGLIVLPASIEGGIASSEKIPTGIEGLDSMLNGGVYRNSITLLSGEEGVGKTTLSLQISINLARRKERALFISFEEPASQIRRVLGNYRMGHEEVGDKFHIASFIPEAMTPLRYYKAIKDLLDTYSPSVLAIDSVTAIQNTIGGHDFLRFMRYIQLLCKCRELAVFVTSSQHDLKDFPEVLTLADNILLMIRQEAERKVLRSIQVYKMRGSVHENMPVPFKITGNGISLLYGGQRAGSRSRE